MKRVIVESPLSSPTQKGREHNKRYARLCMRDCLDRGEAPFASHALYDHEDVLDDAVESERRLGMEAGFAWGDVAALTVVYTDLGMSRGMKEGIARAVLYGRPIEHRSLHPELMRRFEEK